VKAGILEWQADRLELLLSSHKIHATIVGGTVTPRTIRFQVQPRIGTRLAQIECLSEEIALGLSAPSCRVVRDMGSLYVEIPRNRSRQVALLDIIHRLDSTPPCAPVLGLDQDAKPLLLSLASPEVTHVLICGTTGSGKTALARSMALSLALSNPQRDLQLVLVDPKGQSFECVSTLPHLVAPPESDVSDIVDRLAWLVEEMERRESQRVHSPAIVVFVDELADLLMVGGQELGTSVTRLLQRGRQTGIHVVACTQKPTVVAIGSLAKANFPARLVGAVTSADEARLAAGIPGTGAEALQGRGDFVLVVRGHVRRFCAAFISESEAHVAAAGLSQRDESCPGYAPSCGPVRERPGPAPLRGHDGLQPGAPKTLAGQLFATSS
jgi:S-DNA-T family DNA segregation ATPase FtsK/SpoIIIE